MKAARCFGPLMVAEPSTDCAAGVLVEGWPLVHRWIANGPSHVVRIARHARANPVSNESCDADVPVRALQLKDSGY
ncbi:hypothetical protein GCM10007061_10320 [Kocuria marina]|nr:hypothetical protein GCM10007061_10320 [Kocuria marina]